MMNDFSDGYLDNTTAALPEPELTNKDFNNIFNKGKDMSLDSVQEITNWFKLAKPKPTHKDTCTQMGVHFEEVAEMADSIRAHNSAEIINEMGNLLKSALPQSAESYLNNANHLELLDSLCDQIVTAVGVGYMMDFDMLGALCEVIRSNNSKMVDGKFIFDDNGKIMKPDTYSEPDLIPYLKKF
jgi:hypothetical protein